jgi:A/G-specific adenine glycosylase
MERKDSRHIAENILSWYARHQRDLPWRNTRDPYYIWISEVMLQQTQVETVIPYYHRFVSQFPTVRRLAEASLDRVLKAWENMGYYARARNLHAAAREIAKRFGGKIPDTWDGLMGLPGIGQYTAGAILSMAFGLPWPAVDANVRRVMSRLFASTVHMALGKGTRPIGRSRTFQPGSHGPGGYNLYIQETRVYDLPPTDLLPGPWTPIAGNTAGDQKAWSDPAPPCNSGDHS